MVASIFWFNLYSGRKGGYCCNWLRGRMIRHSRRLFLFFLKVEFLPSGKKAVRSQCGSSGRCRLKYCVTKMDGVVKHLTNRDNIPTGRERHHFCDRDPLPSGDMSLGIVLQNAFCRSETHTHTHIHTGCGFLSLLGFPLIKWHRAPLPFFILRPPPYSPIRASMSEPDWGSIADFCTWVDSSAINTPVWQTFSERPV